MELVLDGDGLSIENVAQVAREGMKVRLHPEAEQRIRTCRALLERKLEGDQRVKSQLASFVDDCLF